MLSRFVLRNTQKMGKGIGKERDTHPFLAETEGFHIQPSGKGAQRNPLSGNPHGGDGIPFFPAVGE